MKLLVAGVRSPVASDIIRRAIESPAITSLFVTEHQIKDSPQILRPSKDVNGPSIFRYSTTKPPNALKLTAFKYKLHPDYREWMKKDFFEEIPFSVSDIDVCIW